LKDREATCVVLSAASPPRVRLEVRYAGATQVYTLPAGEYIIGRPARSSPTPAIPLSDENKLISREHALLTISETNCSLTHKGQRQTLLNKQPLHLGLQHILQDGDHIEIEGREIVVHFITL